MKFVKDINSLKNFVGYVVLCAPQDFPREDFLTETEQMTLGKAFALIRNCVNLLESDIPNKHGRVDLDRLVDASHEAYNLGDRVKGANLIQDFRELALERYR